MFHLKGLQRSKLTLKATVWERNRFLGSADSAPQHQLDLGGGGEGGSQTALSLLHVCFRRDIAERNSSNPSSGILEIIQEKLVTLYGRVGARLSAPRHHQTRWFMKICF